MLNSDETVKSHGMHFATQPPGFDFRKKNLNFDI